MEKNVIPLDQDVYVCENMIIMITPYHDMILSPPFIWEHGYVSLFFSIFWIKIDMVLFCCLHVVSLVFISLQNAL
jgi:hypothetical protein